MADQRGRMQTILHKAAKALQSPAVNVTVTSSAGDWVISRFSHMLLTPLFAAGMLVSLQAAPAAAQGFSVVKQTPGNFQTVRPGEKRVMSETPRRSLRTTGDRFDLPAEPAQSAPATSGPQTARGPVPPGGQPPGAQPPGAPPPGARAQGNPDDAGAEEPNAEPANAEGPQPGQSAQQPASAGEPNAEGDGNGGEPAGEQAAD